MEKFDIMRVDGHTLRVFLAVFETGSVSRTAELFGLNQSTISHSLEKMRAAVADPLFVKQGRGITATERATSIVPQVQEILANLEGLVEVEDYDTRRDQAGFCVGLPTPALVPQMKAVLRVLRNAAPGIQFQIGRVAPRERMAEMLNINELDLAIAVNASGLPSILNSTHYAQDHLVVFFDPELRGPITSTEEYAKARHAVAGFGGRTKSIVEVALEEYGLRREISLISPTASSLGEFVLGTDLIATMPASLAKSSYHKLAHCDPPFEMPMLKYDLVWHRRFEHSGRNKWFRNLLLEHANERGAP